MLVACCRHDLVSTMSGPCIILYMTGTAVTQQSANTRRPKFLPDTDASSLRKAGFFSSWNVDFTVLVIVMSIAVMLSGLEHLPQKEAHPSPKDDVFNFRNIASAIIMILLITFLLRGRS